MHELTGLPTSGASVLMLGRKELQRLAKKHGIKANLSSDAIVDQLLELRARMERDAAAATIITSSPATREAPGTAVREAHAPPGEEPGAFALSASAVEPMKEPGVVRAVVDEELHSVAPRGAQPADASHSCPEASAAASFPRLSPAHTSVTYHHMQLQGCAPSPSLGASDRKPQVPRVPAGTVASPFQRSVPTPHAAAVHLELGEAIIRRKSATPLPFERKQSAGIAGSPVVPRPTVAAAPGSAAGGTAGSSSLAKRKSPGFMAPLRRHSSVDCSLLKRQSSGAPRTPGRGPAEHDEKEANGNKENARGSSGAPIAGIDPALAKSILHEIVLSSDGVSWDDIGAPRGP